VKILENDDFKVMGSDYWTDENKTALILLNIRRLCHSFYHLIC